jgi:hypothetical protein
MAKNQIPKKLVDEQDKFVMDMLDATWGVLRAQAPLSAHDAAAELGKKLLERSLVREERKVVVGGKALPKIKAATRSVTK